MTVYADNAATTALSPAAAEAMNECSRNAWGNPSSLHAIGRAAAAKLDEARADMAACLGAAPGEIYFTSGGSESDNWALRGLAAIGAKKGKRHLISTKFEHHAILHTLKKLEKEGYEVTLLEVHEDGRVRPDELEAAIRPDTALVSVMYANNEIGTIQPIAALAKIAHAHGVPFHTDAVQAVGHLPINAAAEGIDLLSLSGHKFHGPKGVGALYCRKGINLTNLIEGGAQERGRRAGTENVPAICGMAAALRERCSNLDSERAKVSALRDRLIEGLSQIPLAQLNGSREARLPGNVNFSFPGVEGESMLLMLDGKGVCGSSGSACASGSLDPSHVLLAIGLPHEVAHGSLRLSLDEINTEEEIDYILEVLPPIVERLRSMSPVWKARYA